MSRVADAEKAGAPPCLQTVHLDAEKLHLLPCFQLFRAAGVYWQQLRKLFSECGDAGVFLLAKLPFGMT